MSSTLPLADELPPVLDASTSETLVRFHLSLNVNDLPRAAAFYRVLLGVEPAKVRPDYVKFETAEPPLVLSLAPVAHAGGGPLNHVGMRLIDAERLVQAQARLEMAGYSTQREEGVSCCYARQTKFWVADPDRTLWELYILHEDELDHPGEPRPPAADATSASASCCAPATIAPRAATAGAGRVELNVLGGPAGASPSGSPTPAVWIHMLTQSLPERLNWADGTLDEIHLEGTFNVPHEPGRLEQFLAEAWRALCPGGQIFAHGLVTDRRLAQTPSLPGPAVLVSYLPLENEPAAFLAAAGFVNLHFTKLAAKPNFVVDGAELRELKLSCEKPAAGATPGTDAASACVAIYRGPFREIIDDSGHRFVRGERVPISAATLCVLRSGPLAEQFTFV